MKALCKREAVHAHKNDLRRASRFCKLYVQAAHWAVPNNHYRIADRDS